MQWVLRELPAGLHHPSGEGNCNRRVYQAVVSHSLHYELCLRYFSCAAGRHLMHCPRYLHVPIANPNAQAGSLLKIQGSSLLAVRGNSVPAGCNLISPLVKI